MSLDPAGDRSFFDRACPHFLIGVDEVGVACLAGPLVSGAFCLDLRGGFPAWDASVPVCDSKTLPPKIRAKSKDALLSLPGAWSSVVEVSPSEVDLLNPYHASGLAQARAVEGVLAQLIKFDLFNQQVLPKEGSLCGPMSLLVLCDGPRVHRAVAQCLAQRADNPLPLATVKPLIKGDTKSFVVAAASILAKEYRDTLMHRLSDKHPGYGWESNVGYPTARHKAALIELGPNEWHRKSFSDVREALKLQALKLHSSVDARSTSQEVHS